MNPVTKHIGPIMVALLLMIVTTVLVQSAEEGWVQRYGRTTTSYEYARKVVTDSAGNVIVAGSADGSTVVDYLIIKYSGTGIPLWTNRYNGPGNDWDEARAVAVDGNGNVLVTGSSFASGFRNPDYATVAYTAAGVPLWTNRYNGPANSFDEAFALAVDDNGDVIVTGYSARSGSGYDYATIKYSGAGVPLWTNRYNGPGNFDDYATAVGVEGGDVVVTGYSAGDGSGYDYATIKYSGAGVPLWTNRYNGQANGEDVAWGVAVDGTGTVFVTGHTANTNAFPYNFDYATVAYSGGGIPLWTNRIHGAEAIGGMALDGAGNVFVIGYCATTDVPPYNDDYTTVAYSGAGVPMWTNQYNGPEDGIDQAKSVAVDGSGNVFVTGYSWGGSSYDFVTIKYSSASHVPIPLDHQVFGNQLVLSWTNAVFHLQSAPALEGSYTNIYGATSPYTNPMTSLRQYFRLMVD